MEETLEGVIVALGNAVRRQAKRLVRLSYKYQPLDASKNEIRLLELPPLDAISGFQQSSNDDIEATLVHVRLDEPPPYSALSYRWGQDNDAEAIVIDRRQVKISRTLKCALQELQHPTERQLVWVDALCINQKDDDERSEQVSKMREVYSHAVNVVVWLGEGTPASLLASDLISDLYNHLQDLEYLNSALLDRQRQPQWTALIELLLYDYWQRIWVIQEVNSARSKVLKWGSTSIQWEHLAAVQHHVYSARNTVSDLVYDVGYSMNLWEMMKWGGPRVVNMPDADPDSAGSPELYDLLQFFRYQLATDSRDMVYALVVLSKARDDPRMVIDYSQSIRQVYMQTVDYVLHQQARLNIICTGHFPPENIHGLPSWTRDWNTEEVRFQPISAKRILYRAFSVSQELSAEATIDKEQGVLRARGFLVDSVSVFGKDTGVEGKDDLERRVVAVLQWYSLSLSYHTDNHDESFIRTLICDRYTNRVTYDSDLRFLKNILRAVCRFASQLLPPELIPEQLSALSQAPWASDQFGQSWMAVIYYSIFGRRFFISKRGSMGLCPADYQDGDIIVILLGCSVPVLLRPYEEHYELIGDVFLYGYMYGKGIDELNEGKFKLETFDIH